MNTSFSRRKWLLAVPGVPLASGLLLGIPAVRADEKKVKLRPGFPRQDAKLVREVVGASHANEAKLRELVTAKPALVNAWWDWGFGDWESPLGAASHTGRRAIAEFLLEKGARIDIFAAAMLGMTDVVKAFVAAKPGVQRTLGPHGITLLTHATLGGKQAEKTLEYLKSLGDADEGLTRKPVDADRKSVYLGQYAADDGEERFEIKLNKAGMVNLEIKFGDETTSQMIHCSGDDEFFPSGVPSVKLRFDVKDGKAQSFTIHEKDIILKAQRVKT